MDCRRVECRRIIMNQAVYTNDIKRLGNALGSPMIPASPLKFRTAGFPQYGFKLEFDSDLRLLTYTLPEAHISSPYGSFEHVNGTFLLSDPVQRPLAPLRVIVSRWIIAYYGLIRAAHNRLTPYFLRLSNILSMSGSLLLSAILSYRAVSRTPVDWIDACDCFFSIHKSLRQIRSVSASTVTCIHRFYRSCNEAVLSSLSLRPDRLLARHRHGLLHSSFQLRSHLLGLSSISTRSTVNCRGWTYTSKNRSLVGCERICTDRRGLIEKNENV